MTHYGKQGGQFTQQKQQTDYSKMTKYYDENGLLRREVFIDWPKQIAKSLGISRTSLRRAYDFVSAMRFRIQMGEDTKAVLQPGMGILHRFVQYQAGRDKQWAKAKEFFSAHINAVGNDGREFEGFYQLFQSVMAYLRR